MIKGTVAIVGRPNVGKSTLFNGLTRTRNALVDDRPGVTRDRLYGQVYFDDERERGFLLIDTGGFETEDLYYQPFQDNIVWHQTELAIDEADLVILVFDGRAGAQSHDAELVRLLARKNKAVIFVVNKLDLPMHDAMMFDFYQLGVETMIATSSAHMRGIDELLEAIEENFKKIPELKSDKRHIAGGGVRIALVGRPNAGKSSILNRLLGEERSLVSEVAGTTRDSLDTPLVYNERQYTLVDTAGIRRRSRINDKIESLSVMRSMQAIERSDIVLLVMDATQSLTDQDARIADLAASQYKAMAIIVNKWDLVPDKENNSTRNYTDFLRDRLSLLSWVPVIYVSCLENQRVHKIMQLVEEISEKFAKRADTRSVNNALRKMVYEHTPALIKATSKRVKFYYATQVRTSPPSILIFCNVAREIQEGYKRYMINRFREDLGFDDVPLRLIFRAKEEANRRRQEEVDKLARKFNPERGKSKTSEISDDTDDELPQFNPYDAQGFEFEVSAQD
ncbi:MAG: ribosome biogenesis GTPase Der [Proteobacteria bacterium]|nr:ribosome biogenesis GTPase Der [Pseudomonadota bacterium]